MRHQILYQPSFSLAVVSLERGEQIMTESGAMVSMSPTIRLEAAMSGGGFFGAMKSAIGGESLFRTTFTAEDRVRARSPWPRRPSATSWHSSSPARTSSSSPAAIWRATPGWRSACRDRCGACSPGEGLFLLTVQGSGLLLLSSFGAIHSKQLAPGEEYIVDTGHIVAFEGSIDYRLEKATGKTQGVGGFLKGMVQSALSGEGFVCRYRGPGKIYIQTRQLPGFARQLLPFLPKPSSGG